MADASLIEILRVLRAHEVETVDVGTGAVIDEQRQRK